jgi:serine/threonine protein phosphatase PrpC
MSRSLGDENGKKLGFLTAEPNIVHANLDELKEECGSDCEHFLVVSSDGVLDFFPPLELANFVALKLYQTQPPVALEQIMADALDLAARRWKMQITMGGYRDDMTLVISKLSNKKELLKVSAQS